MALFKITINRATLIFSLLIVLTILFDNKIANCDPDRPIYTPGQIFRDCPNCPDLVVVPPGSFIMGLGSTSKNSQPAHQVRITKPFAIGRFEIKFSEWQSCMDAGGCKTNPDDHLWGKNDRPVINITFFEAKNYITWISKKTGYRYRLPSESEWAYANRAGTSTHWWWGDKVGKNNANCKDCGSPWSDNGVKDHGTSPVGMFPPNPFGLHDTTANVFEWVEDCWNSSYKGAPTDGSAWTKENCNYRVIRGGSFYYYSKVGRSAYRAKNPSKVKSYWLGFRILRELNQ
jgi:formylglycine-generating enzyme required for sulfatase activity|tara:strand:+ start:645 stop:1505 length:861 start_codon:yes stop_codon:yes gene_type:complete